MTPDIESRGVLPDWLSGIGPFVCETGGYHITLIRVRRNADFDYLYIQRQYHGTGIKRDNNFDYAGIYCKRDGLIYDGQYGIRDLFDKADDLTARGAETLQKILETAVHSAVEAAIGNDRNNLRITELASGREVERLAQFQKYSAQEQARKAFLDSDDDEDSGFDFTFRCDYSPDRWTEDSFLAYILDPDGYINAQAKAYIDSYQEAMLSAFLEGDVVAAAYMEIVKNPSNPVHRVKRIMRVLSASSAKTVTVTIRKDEVDFTFKADASQFRSDCISHYSDWNIVASDRREFERLFGRGAHYGPDDILRIEYARSVLYTAEKQHNQKTAAAGCVGDCLACGHSMSDTAENAGDSDRLFCAIKQDYVSEDGSCEKFNLQGVADYK